MVLLSPFIPDNALYTIYNAFRNDGQSQPRTAAPGAVLWATAQWSTLME
jgi:hypothetical protein